MKKRLEGGFAHSPVISGDHNEFLTGMVIFRLIAEPVESIKNIMFCGVPIEEIDGAYCQVYLGNQEEADKVLLENVPGWTPNHIARGVPYIALRVKHSARFSDMERIEIFADIEQETAVPPMKDGYYWLRRDGQEDVIVKVRGIAEGGDTTVVWPGSHRDSSLEEVLAEGRCRWFGPLNPTFVNDLEEAMKEDPFEISEEYKNPAVNGSL